MILAYGQSAINKLKGRGKSEATNHRALHEGVVAFFSDDILEHSTYTHDILIRITNRRLAVVILDLFPILKL